ncbi:4-hydroxy-tetrahydrodipicolinate reductase [soil metagenome]
MKTSLAINGAAGRMGQRLVALAAEDPGLHVVAAIDRVASPGIVTELPLSVTPQCVIDFSSPDGTMAILKTCVARKLPLVIATTGLEHEHKAEIATAAHLIPVLLSPSMSLVVNLLFKLTKLTSEVLAGKGFDVEIVERHHRHKKDSPSGTAVQFAKIVQEAMKQTKLLHGREGLVGERTPDEIGMHAIRGGDSVGEHTIIFAAPGETLELVHKGSSRDSYARGALLAAKFLAGQGAGTYTMADVLGL